MPTGRREAQEKLLHQVEAHIQSWLSPNLHDGSTEARLRGLAYSILATLDGDKPGRRELYGAGYKVQPNDADHPFLNISGDLAERKIDQEEGL